MKLSRVLGRLSAAATLSPLAVLACDSCYGPIDEHASKHVRVVKRMQPGALDARYGPTRPLQWGQLNVLHTVCSPSRSRIADEHWCSDLILSRMSCLRTHVDLVRHSRVAIWSH
ncbi:hypothetical protein B0T21DRAFT_25171 [Apiosordaria backusii]|uniref:Secreted protein n=1 Tax=Apiosordaria backusii TaxID=314023 RepID=A0AA40EZU7_9PEZI|nr:hypothetical protein B0T21DRAFT_25171 [Apiosordaria backusii]